MYLFLHACRGFFMLLLRRGKRADGDGDEEEDDLNEERSAIALSKAGAKKAIKAEAEYESDVSSVVYTKVSQANILDLTSACVLPALTFDIGY